LGASGGEKHEQDGNPNQAAKHKRFADRDYTSTGLEGGKEGTLRLWLRGGQPEAYIDDMLMQSFFTFTPS
jgi:hypothetical protein